MKKNYRDILLVGIAGSIILGGAFNLRVWAVEEPYSIISKKNLFHPERKEWLMEKAEDKKPEDAKKALPKMDPKQIQLMGTVVSEDVRKAIINSGGKGADKGAQTYQVGDYVEGYLLKEISEKKAVINNNATNEDIILFLHEGKAQRSSQKTEIKEEAPAQPEGKKIVPKKGETAAELADKVKKTIGVLKSGDSVPIRKQAERDLEKLQRLMPVMSDEERGKAAQLRRELEETAKRKK